MPNAVVMTGYGPPEVLKWAQVPLPEPGEGQIRIKVKAAGISPTDLALRAGYLKAIPLPPDAVLGYEAAGTVESVGPGVTGASIGDGVTALLLSLGGYAEYAVASIWTRKPDTVSWTDAAALPSSAEAAARVLRQLNVTSGETLLLFGGGGSVGIIATQLAVAQGVTVISAVGEHDEALARELGATPVRYGAGVTDRVRALGAVDAVFDAAGTGVLADAIDLAGGPKRVITGSMLMLLSATVAILLIDRDRVLFVKVTPPAPGGALFASAAEKAYLLLGCMIGAAGAPLQAASRSLLIRIAPKDRIAQYFGLLALTGKVTSFTGPLLIGVITAATASQKAGMSVLVIFFLVGMLLLSRVRE